MLILTTKFILLKHYELTYYLNNLCDLLWLICFYLNSYHLFNQIALVRIVSSKVIIVGTAIPVSFCHFLF